MPQLHLPIFPTGLSVINEEVSFSKDERDITYYAYGLPIFTHAVSDRATFLVAMAQLYTTGRAKQAELSRAFGIPLITIKRAVKLFRNGGVPAFYAVRPTRGAAVLTPDVMQQLQTLLDEGKPYQEAATQLQLKPDTVSKAIRAGRLHIAKKKT